METLRNLRPIVRAYVLTVVAVGIAVLTLSVHSLFVSPIGSEWLVLAGLTILTGSFSVKVPSINAYISVSEAFVFASVLLFGAEAGTVTVLLECLVILLWMKPQGRPLYRMLFNLAAPSVAIWCAGKCFYLISGIEPYSQVFTPLPSLFVPLLAFTAAYFLFNSSLVAVAVGLETQRSPATIWWKNFAWLSVNYFSGASLAALIVTYTQRLEFSTLAVIVPLLVVSYLTFRTAMGRAEDSYNHLSELNRLYLSTIETLAMAIDAKDQITHGHIRRVQIYAVGLARHVGVADHTLLKAIEAAALLHDMGKLAVPEHILNKPGKLTPAEFEKMKLHAGVGADILSAIEFPYPVVPIVRHHHENWDGSGYPTGLRGTAIPIGARILSVVDCFDALTSDRPYRPRLSDEEALDILRERRGTMYDPLVVDTFIRVHREISPELPDVRMGSSSALTEITSATTSGREPTAMLPPSSASDAKLGDDLAKSLTDMSTSDGDLLDSAIRLAVPFAAALWYRYDRFSDHLVVHSACGLLREAASTLQIPVGERLSGWVAANRRSIANSDPALDLGDLARRHGGLSHALCVPLVSGKDILGVVALYRTSAFSEHERHLMEVVARVLAERSHPGDPRPTGGAAIGPVSSVLCIEIVNWELLLKDDGDAYYGRQLADLVVRLEGILGTSDLLVRSRDNELAVLISRSEAKDVRDLARRLRYAVAQMNRELEPRRRFEVSIDALLAPLDSAALWELLAGTARPRDTATPFSGSQEQVH